MIFRQLLDPVSSTCPPVLASGRGPAGDVLLIRGRGRTECQGGNRRLAGKSEVEYVAIMNALNLPDPESRDTAAPLNRACGQA